MDPSIMKLLEEDEDESMHSGADVEAFQAALNRDIGGHSSTSQPSPSDKAVPQGDNTMPGQSYPGWQLTNQVANANSQTHKEQKIAENPKQIMLKVQPRQHESLADPQQNNSWEEVNQQQLKQEQVQDGDQLGQEEQHSIIRQSPGMQASGKDSLSLSEPGRMHTSTSESQYLELQKMSNQQATVAEQAPTGLNHVKQVPFGLLLPGILPQLDKDRAMQLQTLYTKLKKNDIPKEEFVRIMKGIVGDQMLKLAVMKMRTQPSRQLHIQGSTSTLQQHPRMQHATTAKPSDSSPPGHVHSPKNRNGPKSEEVEQIQESRLEQQQQHFQNTQAFPKYGSPGGYHPFGRTSVISASSPVKTQPNDLQMKQIPIHPSLGSIQPGGVAQTISPMTAPKFNWQHPKNDNKRGQSSALPPFAAFVKREPVDHFSNQQESQLSSLHGPSSVSAGHLEQMVPIPETSRDNSLEQQSPWKGCLPPTNTSTPHLGSLSTMSAQDSNIQLGSRAASTPAGNNVRTPSKKTSISQKKPLETLGSSPPPSSKKQKVSGTYADQSIEQLVDVTAVSGVNLREEEEQLFSGPKEDSRVSEASRRVVQEEEESLILQRAPLQKKLAEIMAQCGVNYISNDVERCLSLSVEERLRSLLSNLIRVSKQRVDVERCRHQTIVTSDVRQHLMILNRRAKEEWEKKQAKVQKLRKESERPEGSQGVDGDKEKDEGCGKSVKANKEEDDKMKTTAANVAARAAVGGDDLLSKWQLMAEQARKKREGGSQVGKDSQKSSISRRSNKDIQETGKRGQTASGAIGKLGRSPVIALQQKVSRTISVKDVIAVLEREPQMAKSSLIYSLYNKVRSETSG